MPSFRIAIPPSRRAAARFVTDVRRLLQMTLAKEAKNGITQSTVARDIGVHRSVINRELRGAADIGMGRVAELGWAMGKTPRLVWADDELPEGSNTETRSHLESLDPQPVGASSDNDEINRRLNQRELAYAV